MHDSALEYMYDNKKLEMYLYIQNLVVEAVKDGRMQALIGRLSARAVTQEGVLEIIGKRLSETFFDSEEIMNVLGKRFKNKADIVVSCSVDRAH